jgi:hypothetical protein
MFHDGTDAFGRNVATRHVEDGEIGEMCHYKANTLRFCRVVRVFSDSGISGLCCGRGLALLFRFARGYGGFSKGLWVRTVLNHVPRRYGRGWAESGHS